MSEGKQRVAVIGAGLSGLVAAKELLEEGHDVVLFERESRLGGNFSTGAAYARMRLTVSQYFMTFSSMAPPLEQERRYWTQHEYVDYLEAFAEKFGVKKRIQFSTRVTKIRRLSEAVFSVTHQSPKGLSESEFSAVAICKGAHRLEAPRQVAFNGAEKFRGEITHAAHWKGPEHFAGKRVVCVGLGETSADITREISDVSAACVLCIRAYPPLVARYTSNGDTNDSITSRLHHWSAPRYIKAVAKVAKLPPDPPPRLKAMAEWAMKANPGKFLQKNDDFVDNMVAGKIKVLLGQIKELNGNTVLFDDGTSMEADAIMQCTGFEESSIPNTWVEGLEVGDIRELYKHMFHPNTGSRVAFIGWARPTQGGVPACSEMQSRLFALICSGTRTLPPRAEMMATIEADASRERARHHGNLNMGTLVDYVGYLDDLASLIGCKPTLENYLEEPELLYRLICGSNIGATYRLEGPHATPEEARKVILRLPVVDFLNVHKQIVPEVLPDVLHGHVDPATLGRICEIVERCVMAQAPPAHPGAG